MELRLDVLALLQPLGGTVILNGKTSQNRQEGSAIDRQMLKNLSHGAGPALFLWVYKESRGWPKAAGANVSRSPGQMHPVFDTEP